MPMPNTKAPMTSDGPIGAMVPPKPGTSEATGTITPAAMAISSNPPRKPSAWPRTIRRRHEAVKLNSALRNTAPSAKPNTSRAAAAGWPSTRTSAISTASASAEASRNGQSRRGTRAATADSVAETLMVFPDERAAVYEPKLIPELRPQAELLLEIVEAGARRCDRTAQIGGPFDHRAGEQAHVGPAKHGRQHEPVRRRPMPSVAVGHDRAGRQRRRDPGKLLHRPQPVGRRIIEAGAVEIDR